MVVKECHIYVAIHVPRRGPCLAVWGHVLSMALGSSDIDWSIVMAHVNILPNELMDYALIRRAP
jgi:hypothetical protein